MAVTTTTSGQPEQPVQKVEVVNNSGDSGSKKNKKYQTSYICGVVMFILASAVQITYIMSFEGTGPKEGALVLQSDNKTELNGQEKASLLFTANLLWFLGLAMMVWWGDQHPMITFTFVLATLGSFMMTVTALTRACTDNP
jgi:hypothetical protein